MKLKIKRIKTKLVTGFTNQFVSYGKILTNDTYRIDIGLPEIPYAIPLYRSKQKPSFRNITAISALWLPIAIPLMLIICIVFFALVLVLGFLWFYDTCLFKNSFITNPLDKISGYVSLVLSVIGLVAVIYGIFNIFNNLL